MRLHPGQNGLNVEVVDDSDNVFTGSFLITETPPMAREDNDLEDRSGNHFVIVASERNKLVSIEFSHLSQHSLR